jgi:hypothetical protein
VRKTIKELKKWKNDDRQWQLRLSMGEEPKCVDDDPMK